MNVTETATLLAMVAANDRRTVGEVDIEVWHDALHDLRFDDCRDAVRHHIRNSRDWLTPYDVRQAVRAIRGDRLARTIDAVPDADPDDALAYRQALVDGRHRTADGIPPQPERIRALVAGAFHDIPPADPQPELGPRNAPNLTGLPPVDDPGRLAEARAEVAARQPIPLPDEAPPAPS